MLVPYLGPARIVVGFDGSDDSFRALAHGVREALLREAELVLVHAVDDTVLNSAWGVVFDPEQIKEGAAEMLANTPARSRPSCCTATIMATAMKVAIRPYSMAVAPDSSLKKRETNLLMLSPPLNDTTAPVQAAGLVCSSP